MADEEVAFLSAAATASGIRAKEFSPVEVVRAYLARISRLDPTLRAYITVSADAALAAAREKERALLSGAACGPLFGVPVAVKDQFWTRGILTTNGSRAFRDFTPSEDATVIVRLAQAGAILLGKLAMSELALGGTRNPAWGITRNPWDLERTPGESSSGSGTALAAHLCAASVGEDYRRFGPCAGRLLQRSGTSADVWTRQPPRLDGGMLVPGSGCADDQDRRRLCIGPRRHRRT